MLANLLYHTYIRNKMRVLTILFILLTANLSYSQNYSRNYTNQDFFKGKAIIFNKNYKPPIKLPSNIERFSPSDEEIILTESLIANRYDKDINWGKETKNVKKKYWKYNRQYLGYIDSQGNKKIVINLLNFKCRKKAQEKFEGWKNGFVIGFGEYYEKNSLRLVADLTSKKISLL